MLRMRTLAALLVCGTLSTAAHAQDPVSDRNAIGIEDMQPAPIPFELDSQGYIFVRVRIGDNEPLLFILDTGSSQSAVSERVAARLAAPIVRRSRVVSLGGPAVRLVVRLPTLTLGGMRKDGVLATVLGSSELRSLAGRAEGILGMDVLGDQRYTLDYRKRLLRWDASSVEGARNSVQLQVRWYKGRYLVALPQRDGRALLWLLADSGAETLVLFRRRGMLHTMPLAGSAVLDTTGGKVRADPVLVPKLRLGDLALRNVAGVEIPVRGDRASGDGLLPLHLFAQVCFDPGTNSMTVVLH